MKFLFPTLSFVFVCGLVGCSASTVPLERAAARGTVTLDGELVSQAKIAFIHRQDDENIRVETAIVDGVFQFDKMLGPVIGENKIEFLPDEIELEELAAIADGDIPAAFVLDELQNAHELTLKSTRRVVTVHLDESLNQFDFELESE